ncbi:MAG: hypothetical protein IPM96_08600 [Ignavibacteria bacterium]|nr:hypothetical protein [Ignavibacteria bacterium]
MLNPGTDTKLAADILTDEIKLFFESDINDREFERIKNQLEFRNVTKNLKMNNISIETVKNYMNFRDTNLINTSFKKFSSVTKADIKKTVKSNLIDKKKFTLNYVPKK